jgi:hypothetical protein
MIGRSIRVACAPADIHAHVTRTGGIGEDGAVRIPVRRPVSTGLRDVCGIHCSAARIGLRAPRVGGAGRVADSGVPKIAVGCPVKKTVAKGVGNRRISGIASIRRRQLQERSSTADRA